MKVKILDLKITDEVLKKSGYDDEILTMENLVPWKSLKSMQSFSRGPGVTEIMYKMSWLAVLKIMLEVTLVGLGKNPNDPELVDPSLAKQHKEKHASKQTLNKRISSDDFQSVKKKKKPHATKKSLVVEHPIPVVPWPSPLPPSTARSSGNYPRTPPCQLNEDSEDDPRPSQDFFADVINSPASPLGIPRLDLNKAAKSPKTKTPERRMMENPLHPFLNATLELEKSRKHTSLYKGKVVQVIGLNKLNKNAVVNIRISDSQYWVDCEVGQKLKIYFVGDSVRVNDFIIIDATSGTLGGQDFKILNLRRPGHLHRTSHVKIGCPLPLLSGEINCNRGLDSLNITPLVGDQETLKDWTLTDTSTDEEDNLLDNETTLLEDANNTADLEKTLSLDELLNMTCPPKKQSVADTPLADEYVSELEVRSNTISRFVFENARHLYLDRQHDVPEVAPKITGRKIQFTVESEFNKGEYIVIIEWPELMPRVEKPFCKTFALSCSCPGFVEFGPKFCKHIVFVIMKYLNYT